MKKPSGFLDEVKKLHEASLDNGIMSATIFRIKEDIKDAANRSLDHVNIILPIITNDKKLNDYQIAKLKIYFEQEGFKWESHQGYNQRDPDYITVKGWV